MMQGVTKLCSTTGYCGGCVGSVGASVAPVGASVGVTVAPVGASVGVSVAPVGARVEVIVAPVGDSVGANREANVGVLCATI